MTTEQIAGHSTYPSSHDELSNLLPGKVVAPGDAAWEAARTPWIVNIDQQSRAVVVVDDARDVTTVRFARVRGLTVAAQPGGHGSTRALDDTILLRTRGLELSAVPARHPRRCLSWSGRCWGSSPTPSRRWRRSSATVGCSTSSARARTPPTRSRRKRWIGCGRSRPSATRSV